MVLAVGDAADAEMTIDIGTQNLLDLWPGFHSAYIEEQTVTTTADGDETSHTAYLDALGNTIATLGNGVWERVQTFIIALWIGRSN